MEREFIITIFSENKVGILSQVTTVFTHRNVNIESIAASPSAIEGIHKYTIMVKNDPERVANLVKQIEKKVVNFQDTHIVTANHILHRAATFNLVEF